MQWNKMSKGQQAAARRIVEKLWAAGVAEATVSQVARHLDEAMVWDRDGSLEELCEAAGWDAPKAPEPEATECTARELATALGVSLSTIYRRIRAGIVAAVKVGRRWVITVPATA